MVGAGLVKLLRRCLTQLSGRTRSFVDTCVRFEKEAAMQVPGPETCRGQHAVRRLDLCCKIVSTAACSCMPSTQKPGQAEALIC